jgi:Ser/Thr protein kinase RdoA (MazF antagonist)
VRQGAVHLDIWFDNLHFGPEHQITLFDFDFCGNGWLALDIAYFQLQLFNTNPNEQEYETKLASFLAGYASVAPISPAEERLVPWLAACVWFFYLGVQCDRFDNWSNIFLNQDHLKRFVGMIKKWLAYHQIELP